MDKIFAKPAPGRLVRHPETGDPLPAEGALVIRSPYWIRRLKDGDVTLATPASGKAVNNGH
ncbi:DUF2635 domain-containing protein [Desulfovibrio sp.]|uniref:DUF2635 domain-containing protein n=1 Tax=Desulfovibrio sp. TaxID=885 RepID=UPI0030774601